MTVDTINVALLTIRVTLGMMLMTHGINKIFGAGGRNDRRAPAHTSKSVAGS